MAFSGKNILLENPMALISAAFIRQVHSETEDFGNK